MLYNKNGKIYFEGSDVTKEFFRFLRDITNFGEDSILINDNGTYWRLIVENEFQYKIFKDMFKMIDNHNKKQTKRG